MKTFVGMIGLLLLAGLAINEAAETWLEWLARMAAECERRQK